VRAALQIARLTLASAARRRVAAAAAALGAVFLLLYAVGLHFIVGDARAQDVPAAVLKAGLTFVVLAGLYAANFLVAMLSALMAIDALAAEIGSGVIETLCTKPARRTSILLGKWLGCVVLVAGSVAFLSGGVLLIARLVAGVAPPHAASALGLVFVEGVLLMTLALAFGTRLPTLANGIVVFGLYGLAFIGGWVEQIGTITGNSAARTVGVVTSLCVPSEALWQRASYLMQPPLVRDLGMTPFTVVSVPSPAMVGWAVGYILVVFVVAARLFEKRDL
jgi:ABC-type transport system involved in multi-copper enzyme maturation permease subunit